MANLWRVTIAIAAVSWSAMSMAQTSVDEVNFLADHSIIDEETLTVTMTGNVHLSSESLELKADKVVVQLVADGPDNRNIDFGTLKASGNIWGRSDDIFITSNAMAYEDKSQSAVFSGNVKVNQGQNQVSSSEVRLNLEQGVYELIGGVRGKLSGSF